MLARAELMHHRALYVAAKTHMHENLPFSSGPFVRDKQQLTSKGLQETIQQTLDVQSPSNVL